MVIVRSRLAIRGFTYLGALFFVAIMSISLALAATLWSFAQQREKERQLLFVGGQFRRAIGHYYERTPGAVKQYPRDLHDLLEDARYATVQRYLRDIYPDPITGTNKWGLVSAPDGGIMGVYSLATKKTIKNANFPEVDKALEGETTYDKWKFIYVPRS
jgi:type II secretory pathway pseudopilin PulG